MRLLSSFVNTDTSNHNATHWNTETNIHMKMYWLCNTNRELTVFQMHCVVVACVNVYECCENSHQSALIPSHWFYIANRFLVDDSKFFHGTNLSPIKRWCILVLAANFFLQTHSSTGRLVLAMRYFNFVLSEFLKFPLLYYQMQ